MQFILEFFAEYSYWIEALLAACRIIFWFAIFFGLIGPSLLSFTRTLSFVEKTIYSWVGMGGILIFWVYALTMLNIYDLVSILLMLCLNPFFRNFSRSNAANILDYLKEWELKALVRYMQILENETQSFWSELKKKIAPSRNISWHEISETAAVGTIALAGAGIRLYPVLQNAAPLSSGWFDHLDRIKNMRLQDYIGASPEPGGMHALVSSFSLLTQVSPEMILHLLGGITTFFLCIIVYWAAKGISKPRYSLAAISGMAVYALTPLLLMPVSIDQEVDAGSLDLALCFGIPTIVIFIRNLRGQFGSPWFYPFMGFAATAMVDLFVAFTVLLTLIFIVLVTTPLQKYRRSSYKILLYLLGISALIILPYLAFCYYNGIDFQQFFLAQLFNIHVYSYFPFLLLPLDELSLVYLSIAAGLVLYYLLRWMIEKKKGYSELIFLALFLLLSSIYLPVTTVDELLWFDIDQFNGFYAIMIAIFITIVFVTLLEVIQYIFMIGKRGMQVCSWVILAAAISGCIFLQGGIKTSRAIPDTIPNGFMEAYYKIISERQPYTYATVGPKVQQVMAKNRNYFMEYSFFLNEYARVDSLYRQQLQLPKVEREGKRIPPASVFVFAEKAPYTSIQQGILYNSKSVMQNIEQWISHYRALPNRKVDVFYSDHSTIVYELVNRHGASQIYEILSDTYFLNNQ
ncbi:MAG TPA: hypothetical protein VK074_02860 [Fodinibius sp.]|nr:hypothetical protein [Fodinibius sp.]